MHKYHCTSPIQLLQHRSQAWIAKVDAAVVGEQSKAIRAQDVRGIGNLVLLSGCGRCVIGHVVAEGDGGEEAEAGWMGGHNLCSVRVHVAGEPGVGCEGGGEACARGGDAEDGFGNADGLSRSVTFDYNFSPDASRIPNTGRFEFVYLHPYTRGANPRSKPGSQACHLDP